MRFHMIYTHHTKTFSKPTFVRMSDLEVVPLLVGRVVVVHVYMFYGEMDLVQRNTDAWVPITLRV